ncbi:hypothetical protein IFM89_006785 [Coptis chinensis]|uniref:Rx N-terminal domain-containing protein n=1 Tax=Coptis chinensis TaxID=261450 RepID=A0A835M793_9MAGN|nr:hypothetical protein IFM89_006785 [Coptis chinensis]
MADSRISIVLEQLASFVQQEVELVVSVREEVAKLINTLKVMQAVLYDAEEKQFKEQAVKVWLEELKNIAYAADDVLDEWHTKTLITQNQGPDVQVSRGTRNQVLSYLLSPCFCFKSIVVHHDIATTGNMEISSKIYNAKNLRTWLTPLEPVHTVPVELYNKLTCLRTLDLGGSDIDKLPNEVGRLLHLRYLNLGGTKLLELPESVCSSYNLQTLELTQCNQIQKLPNGIGKLTNLRHLEIQGTDALGYLPQGIGSLHFLQTLSKFIVGG